MRYFFVAILLLILAVEALGAEDIAYTIRTPDGAVLMIGTPQAVEETKKLVEKWEKHLTASEVQSRLKKEKPPGIREIAAFLIPMQRPYVEWQNRPLEPETLTLQEAERRGLLPYIQGKSMPEARKLLELDGFQVIVPAREIGETDVLPPVDIVVRSAGLRVGNYAQIWVGGEDISPNLRGINIVVIHPATGKIVDRSTFDTTGTEMESVKMARFVERIPEGYIVAVSGKDDVSRKLTPAGISALRDLGSSLDLRRHYRLSYALLGVKGARPGRAVERVAGEPVLLAAFPPSETDPNRITVLERPKCVLLTGTQPTDTISLLFCEQPPK